MQLRQKFHECLDDYCDFTPSCINCEFNIDSEIFNALQEERHEEMSKMW